jgi:hypothetical protein
MIRVVKLIYWLCVAAISVFGIICLLGGCSTLRQIEPDSIPVEVTHVSHITQHQPFTNSPTAFGYNEISAGLKWTPTRNFSIKITDGIVLGSPVYYNTAQYGRQPVYGNLFGPRETFSATLSYDIPLK